MVYKKLIISTSREGADIVAALLFDYAEGGVVILDDKDFNDAVRASIYENPDSYREESPVVKVEAFISIEDFDIKLQEIKDLLSGLKDDFGALSLKVEDYEEKCAEEWKQFHKPIELDKLMISPDWLNPETDKPLLKLTIGSSFGTGQHESTVLALNLLSKLDLAGKTVADLGCGSGILGLAAIKLGAARAYLCDIEAIDEAIGNAEKNACIESCIIETKDLQKCDFKADVILSNIYAPVLAANANKIKSLLNPEGILIMSGIYKEGREQVEAAYQDLKLIERMSSTDWTALMYGK
jgi:ribosomal protein L11 methyltransferase